MVSQGSRSSRVRSSEQRKELLCAHRERPVLQTSTTKENPGRRFWGCVYYEVQDGYDFFRWADPELGGAQQDSENARLRRKIKGLKARLKDGEWKLRVGIAFGMIGWISFVFMWLQNSYKLRQPYGLL